MNLFVCNSGGIRQFPGADGIESPGAGYGILERSEKISILNGTRGYKMENLMRGSSGK